MRRTHSQFQPEPGHCSSLPHRGSRQGNHLPLQPAGAENLVPASPSLHHPGIPQNCSFRRTPYSQTSIGAVRSPPSLPVFGVPRGSTSNNFVSTTANGLCSTPLGTTNISPALNSTAPSLKSSLSSPSRTMNVSSVFG